MKRVSGLARRRGDGRVGHEEADGDDRVVLLVGELSHVRRVVLGVLGLDVLVEAVGLLGRGHGALVGGLVERLVVDLAGVGDEADAEDRGVGAVGVVGGRTRRSGAGAGGGGGVGVAGAAATAGQGQGERRGRCDQVTRGLHEGSPWRSGQTCRCYGLGRPARPDPRVSLPGCYLARGGVVTRSTPRTGESHQPGEADHPASTVTVVPVMPEAAGEARKATVAATSCGGHRAAPAREARRKRSTPSGHASSSPSRSTSPGATPTTRMPRRPHRGCRRAGEVVQRRLGHGIRRVGRGGPQALDRPDGHDDPARSHAAGRPAGAGRPSGRRPPRWDGVPGRGVEVGPGDEVLREGVEHDDVRGADRAAAQRVEQVVAGAVERGGVVDGEVGVEGDGTASGRLHPRRRWPPRRSASPR